MTRAATLDVEIRATGVENVERGLRRVGNTGGDMGRRVGIAGRQMASALENAARSGNLAGQSLKMIVQSGAEMAFMFGAGGAVAGAVVVGLLAIAEHFKRVREEAEKAKVAMVAAFEAALEKDDEGLSRERVGQSKRETEALIAVQEARVAAARAHRDQFTGQAYSIANEQVKKQVATLNSLKAALDAITVAYDRVSLREQDRAEVDRRRQVKTDAKEQRAAILSALGPSIQNMMGNDALTGITGMRGDEFGLQVPKIEVPMKLVPRPVIDESPAVREMKAFIDRIQGMFESAFEDGIANGFQRAFSGEGWAGLFKGFGQTVMAGLGQVFIEVGKSLLAFGAIMEKVKAAIMSGPMGAGIGAIVAGAALIALGGAMSAAAGGMGGRSGSFSAGGGGLQRVAQQSENVTRIVVDPTRATSASKMEPMPMVNAWIIGTDDLKAQRELLTMIRKAQRRGGVG